MKVTIVGAGIAGLATAWALRSRGHQVNVFDQGPIPNPMASSHDEQRYHRFAYGRMSGYSSLALEAGAAWKRVWEALNRDLYIETGVLYLSSKEDEDILRSVDFAEHNGLDTEQIPQQLLKTRYPHFSIAEDARAFLFRQSGILLAERILVSLADWLRESGAVLHPHAKVVSVDHHDGTIETLSGRFQADAIVIAAGPWTPSLVPGSEVLQPARQISLFATGPARLAEAWRRSPALADLTVSGNFYATPPLRGTRIKLVTDLPFYGNCPDDDRHVSKSEIEAVAALAAGSLADFKDYQIVGARSCYYTNTSDRSFFVRRIERSWAVSACSGHGFKFGALAGLAMADAVEGKMNEADTRTKLEARISAPE
ncbi:FAD-dependent oxidoreductase [Aminobacter sp. AP02]|uniref:NAD(P)/FAD-dependent oxidoreductase n=1 Tax=Aminobacter sp. AP02 TaxID=2135737 RepID=UPI000D78FB20|nr:FAD-dependent oxidoreductase [Aminobacter sp. AP02]PWK60361.1 sarcosine oxidase/sarcosine oxidase subunit beta [Aminobacter sp. AP02]